MASGIEDRYLGDGLYAAFDGDMVRLWMQRATGDHEVFLEPSTFVELLRFTDQFWKRRE